ncbi:MAG TPA: polyprenyl diphosphate synthase [Candidatus Nanoarchaeia archaeon]|nr:polyprenyl diphosphate synthase [Candidatus Nanoarchaeia archaeon]
MKPSENKIPRHIGIILDGNRRFAKRLMLKPWKGHEWGAKKVEALFDWCKEYGIKELTLYAFSIENFNRPKQEFNFLMNLFRKELTRMLTDKRIDNDKIKTNFVGRLYLLPKDIQELMQKNTKRAEKYNNYIINFAVAYGGRQEVIDAAKKIAEQIKKGKIDIDKINEETFSKNLYNNDDVDLVIRTGGEQRTSGFLIWQANYAELIFLDKYWPEFTKKDFAYCIEEYSKRQRRFGH